MSTNTNTNTNAKVSTEPIQSIELIEVSNNNSNNENNNNNEQQQEQQQQLKQKNTFIKTVQRYILPFISFVCNLILFIVILVQSKNGYSGFAIGFTLAYAVLSLLMMISLRMNGNDTKLTLTQLVLFPRPSVLLAQCSVVALYLLFLLRLISPPTALPLPRQAISPYNYTYRGPEFIAFGPKEYIPGMYV